MRFLFALVGILWGGAVMATPVTVDYIFDGDTFAGRVQIEDDIQITVRVRLMNVDTPEIHGNCAREIDGAMRARDRLVALMPVGSTVDLRDIRDDKYLGRIDAHVILPDGRDVGRVLIDEGLGRPYAGGKRLGWCD